MIGFTWLWNDVYKGLELRFAETRGLWLGWTKREYKRRGW